MRKSTRFVAVFCACVVPLTAAPAPCYAQEVTFTRVENGFVESIEQNYKVDPGGSLTLEAEIGSIQVDGWTNDEVEIRIAKRMEGRREERARSAFDEIEVILSQRDNDVRIQVVDRRSPGIFGGRVRVSAGLFRSNRVSVEMKVRVPERYTLDLSTVDGSIQIGNIKGPVTASAVDGDIDIESTNGSVKASTTDGHIEIRSTQGTVDASAVDGDIDIGVSNGDVTARTTDGHIEIHGTHGGITARTIDGDIEIRSTEGYVDAATLDGDIELFNANGYVKADAVRGNIVADFVRTSLDAALPDADPPDADQESEPRYHLETTEGDVTIYLPEALAATIEAQGSSGGLLLSRLWRDEVGRIHSDFAMNKSEWGVFFYRQSEGSVDINGGGDRIRLKTNSGNIYIRER